MTVCIAALCDKAAKVLIASDRMLTGGDVEFEQDIRKFEIITAGCMALCAGSALDKVDLIRQSLLSLSATKNPNVGDVVDAIKDSYVSLRIQIAEELHLKPLGLTLKDFLQHQQSLSPDLVLRLTYNIEHQNLGVSVLIVGVDSGGGHIYLISDPGTASCYDSVGFCAIGSGEHHAELAFIRSNYSEDVSLKEALFLAYKGKRDAETAPGVGANYSDLAYVDNEGCHIVSASDIATLRKAYKSLQTSRTAVDSAITDFVESITLSEGG